MFAHQINLSQICGCVGQQSVEGARVFADKGNRTLSCFSKNDTSLEGHGFVQNSYALGLNPYEYFFHAMGGREGLVDTAVKTATTGYIQRRQIKSMEDHKIFYDGTIRNGEEAIIDFSYGGDGMDPCKVERVSISFLKQNEDALKSRFTPSEMKKVLVLKEMLKSCKAHQNPMDDRILLPFSSSRFSVKSSSSPSDEDSLALLLDEFTKDKSVSIQAGVYEMFNVKSLLASSASRETLRSLLDQLETAIFESTAHFGEMVGSVAAQSIGEPCTQVSDPNPQFFPIFPNFCQTKKNEKQTSLDCIRLLLSQMTLNSVEWNTCLVIHWMHPQPPPSPHDKEIGRFIDSLIEEMGERVVWTENETAYLPLPAKAAIALSPSENGEMKWTALKAVTRHLPINKDNTKTLIRIRTQSGRELTVTKGKSLLVFDGLKLSQIDGDKIKVGDRVPVVYTFSSPLKKIPCIDLRSILDANDVFFTCNVPPTHLNNEFKGDNVIRKGGQEKLPRTFPLDYNFGLLIGSYLLNGRLLEDGIIIDVTDIEIMNGIQEWMNGMHIQIEIVFKNSIKCHSRLLAMLLSRCCGDSVRQRRVPSFAFVAEERFVRGVANSCVDVLDGYTFYSKILRDGFCLLLSRFGVRTTVFSSEEDKHHIGVKERSNKTSRLKDTYLERVESIEEIESEHRYVYDLTVEETTNMTTVAGIGCADTFHVRTDLSFQFCASAFLRIFFSSLFMLSSFTTLLFLCSLAFLLSILFSALLFFCAAALLVFLVFFCFDVLMF